MYVDVFYPIVRNSSLWAVLRHAEIAEEGKGKKEKGRVHEKEQQLLDTMLFDVRSHRAYDLCAWLLYCILCCQRGSWCHKSSRQLPRSEKSSFVYACECEEEEVAVILIFYSWAATFLLLREYRMCDVTPNFFSPSTSTLLVLTAVLFDCHFLFPFTYTTSTTSLPAFQEPLHPPFASPLPSLTSQFFPHCLAEKTGSLSFQRKEKKDQTENEAI